MKAAEVFVPMIGDLFLISDGRRYHTEHGVVFVPVIGDLFLINP